MITLNNCNVFINEEKKSDAVGFDDLSLRLIQEQEFSKHKLQISVVHEYLLGILTLFLFTFI